MVHKIWCCCRQEYGDILKILTESGLRLVVLTLGVGHRRLAQLSAVPELGVHPSCFTRARAVRVRAAQEILRAFAQRDTLNIFHFFEKLNTLLLQSNQSFFEFETANGICRNEKREED